MVGTPGQAAKENNEDKEESVFSVFGGYHSVMDVIESVVRRHLKGFTLCAYVRRTRTKCADAWHSSSPCCTLFQRSRLSRVGKCGFSTQADFQASFINIISWRVDPCLGKNCSAMLHVECERSLLLADDHCAGKRIYLFKTFWRRWSTCNPRLDECNSGQPPPLTKYNSIHNKGPSSIPSLVVW